MATSEPIIESTNGKQSEKEQSSERVIRIIRDETILNRIFDDPSLWFYGIATLYIAVRQIVNIIAPTTHDMIFALTHFTIIIAGVLFWEVFRKKKTEGKYIKKIPPKLLKLLPWLTLGFNALILLVFGGSLLAAGKITIENVQDMLFTASWEQMFFALVIPTMIVKALPFSLKIYEQKISTVFLAILISAVLFAVAHMYKHAASFWLYVYYIIIGYIMHFIGYYIPSLSITIHWLFNILILAFK